MRCFLAVFDQAHRTPQGSYWTWRHPDLPPRILDKFYYESAAKHWPSGSRPPSAHALHGGCASAGSEWVCWYRFVDGGLDKAGRPGRYVLLAGLIRSHEHAGRNWSGLLESPEFDELARQARAACPVPAPTCLALDWAASVAGFGSAAVERLRREGRATLPSAVGLALAAEACASLGAGEEFDCFIVRSATIADVTMTRHPRSARERRPEQGSSTSVKFDCAAGLPERRRSPRRTVALIFRAVWCARTVTRWQIFSAILVFLAGFICGVLADQVSFRRSDLQWQRRMHPAAAKPKGIPSRAAPQPPGPGTQTPPRDSSSPSEARSLSDG